MKRFVLVSGDFTTWGGMDRANYALAWHLAESGRPVHLVSHFVAAPLATHPNVTWHRVARPFGRHALAEPLLAFQGRRVARAVSAADPAGTQETSVVVNGGNCAWPGVNWVHMMHSAWTPASAEAPLAYRLRSAWQNRRARSSEKRALGLARFVVANSARTREEILRTTGLPEERVRAVYYGIDAELFRPADPERRRAARRALGLPDSGPIVAFVGALARDRRKGFDVLVDAWRIVCGDPEWNATLVAAGAGDELEFWRRRCVDAGLRDRVRLLGFTQDIPAVLAASDAFVSPVRYEAYGLGIHEALCCGLPAFVTRSAGVAERYPPELGNLLLGDPPNPRDLAARLVRWRVAPEAVRARVAPFAEALRRRTWTDMSREIVGWMEHSAA